MKNKASTISMLIVAVLTVGIVIPTIAQNQVFAPSYLTLVGVNKLTSNEISSCDAMQNNIHLSGDGGDGPLGLQNCGSAPTNGDIYSRNTVQPYLRILKSALQNGDQIDIRLFDTGDDDSLKDHYTYTVHDLDNINTVQIRLCSGPTTDNICNTRVISEQ